MAFLALLPFIQILWGLTHVSVSSTPLLSVDCVPGLCWAMGFNNERQGLCPQETYTLVRRHTSKKQTLYPKTIAIVRTGKFKEARERSPGHWGSEGRLYGRDSMWTQIGQWVGVSRLSEQQGQIKQGSGAYLEDEKERAGICLYLFPAPCFSRHLVSIVILVL